MSVKWLRRIVWIVAVTSGVVVCLHKLLNAAPGGEVIACCIVSVFVWIAIGFLFGWCFGLRRKAKEHLETSLDHAAELNHPLNSETPDDVLQTLHTLSETAHGRAYGLSSGHTDLLSHLKTNPEPSPLTWRSRQTNVDAWKSLPTNAVYFLELNGIHFIAMCRTGHEDVDNPYGYNTRKRSKTNLCLCLVSRSPDDNQKTRCAILEMAKSQSTFRGKTVLVRPGTSIREPVQIEFTSTSPVPKDRIILPPLIFETLDRSTLSQFDASAALQRAGLRTRTAVLLHGPPGTGKTLLTKYLVSRRRELTTILLHGFRRGLVREAFRIARYCDPSIVVIEDVDLIAVARQKIIRGTSALHELLDELDGLAPESKTIVIMTTNRPDVLEPALASRPGRVRTGASIIV